MEMFYETDRLVLRILHEGSASDVLHFYEKNHEAFDPVEPERPAKFYTLAYQQTLLRSEFDMAVREKAVRFWMFRKEDSRQIIGTVSFQNIVRSVYQSCQIGYKLDPDFWHQGYATEGISAAISVIFGELGLHRIEALALPGNTPSIRLLERLGFEEEGLSRSCVRLSSGWTDHLRYALVQHPGE